MKERYDIVVIGGGIIGSSCALHLADEGLKVALINTSKYGKPASEAAAGLLTPFQISELGTPLIADFMSESFKYFKDFYNRIKGDSNVNLGFREAGSLYLLLSTFEIAQKEAETATLSRLGEKVEFNNKRETLKLEQVVTEEIIGSYHYPSEAVINNPKFLKAVLKQVYEKKVKVINKVVKNIVSVKNKVKNIVLENGDEIVADTYVLANGVWANKFLKEINETKEDVIKAVKGEVLEIDVDDLYIPEKILFCKDGYILSRKATNQFERPSILVGSTSEEIDIEKASRPYRNSIQSMNKLSNLFTRLLPSYKTPFIANSWAGFRPKTPDGLPIIGNVTGVDNLFCALGHYRNGILMGPLTGKLLSELIVTTKTSMNIDIFSFDRFKDLELIEDSNEVFSKSITTT